MLYEFADAISLSKDKDLKYKAKDLLQRTQLLEKATMKSLKAEDYQNFLDSKELNCLE